MSDLHLKNKIEMNFVHRLHQAFNSEIQIYNQAILKRSKILHLYSDATYPMQNNQELNILFNLQGELEGKVICTIDLTDKSNMQYHLPQVQSLFTESMNILLGQFLTEIDEKLGLMSLISHPEIIFKERKLSFLTSKKSHDSINMTTEYELLTAKDSYRCSIFILARPKIIKEV